jgi:cell division protein FtsZ
MGSAVSEGENRREDCVCFRLPLLNDNKITGAKNVLLLIVSGSNEITLDEIGKLTTIFKMKRVTMPILLWVLVKTKHW